MYDSGGYIPRGQVGIAGENGPELINGPAYVTSRRRTAALASVVAGMMGGAIPAEAAPLHPMSLPATSYRPAAEKPAGAADHSYRIEAAIYYPGITGAKFAGYCERGCANVCGA